jgi:ABC-type transport system involved in multi-copper enzyme maturation permease subunit
MNFPAAIFAIRWLIRDTFRQSLASGIFWLMLAVSGICAAVCLTVGITGDVPFAQDESGPADLLRPQDIEASARALFAANTFTSFTTPIGWQLPVPLRVYQENRLAVARKSSIDLIQGQVTLMFGAVRIPLTRDRQHAVHFIESYLAGWIADAAGLLLALVWTAGFLPSFLEPSAASVLLAKPIPRWSLLAGKYIGVLCFVAFQAIVFVGATWFALALRTGVWDTTYFLCVPVLLFHFAIFFSFSTLLAVMTRSTVACVFGSLLFWVVCWGMNYGRHMALLTLSGSEAGGSFLGTLELGYWILPKPADIGLLLMEAIQAGNDFSKLLDLPGLIAKDAWHPGLSLLSSLLFAVVMLALAAYEFVTQDY